MFDKLSKEFGLTKSVEGGVRYAYYYEIKVMARFGSDIYFKKSTDWTWERFKGTIKEGRERISFLIQLIKKSKAEELLNRIQGDFE